MRIENKYLRNRNARSKYWHSVRRRSQPYETYMPWFSYYPEGNYTAEEQIKNHFEWIDEQARAMESGHHRSFFHAPKHYRQTLWKQRKAKERAIMARVRGGDHELEFPTFKRDADWLWF